MASRADREHFDRIAAVERELAAEAVREAATRDPSVNIDIGLELSEFAAAFGGVIEREPEVSPAMLWAQMRAGDGKPKGK